jgi:BlaI family transcriptional regulator, penicillinase repressor
MKLSDAEWQIMNALWKQHPATAREILDRMEGEVRWAYTTIKTMLTRLEAKRAVSETKRGNTSVYVPLVDQKRTRSTALHSMFERVLDGAAAPLLSFLIEERKLSKKERAELIRLLREADRKEDDRDRNDQ